MRDKVEIKRMPPESAVGVDAHILGLLSSLLSNITNLPPILGQLIKFDLVVDVNIITADLIYRVKNPEARRTRVQEIAASGLFRLHIPHWALSELENSALDQVEAKRGVSKSAMLQEFELYREMLIVHDAYKWPARSVLADADSKDEPYVALARDINASAILSKDKGVEHFGATRLGIDELIIARLYARAKAASLSAQVMGTAMTGLSIYSVVKIVSFLWQQFQNSSPIFKVATLSLLLAFATSEKAKQLWRSIGKLAEDVLAAVHQTAEYSAKNEALADQKLAEFQGKLYAQNSLM